MTLNLQRFLTAAGGVFLASAAAACTSGSNSSLPGVRPVAGSSVKWEGSVRKPAAASNEFFTGITPNSNPRGIANGPHNDMWFTQTGSDEIGRITAKGVVTEHAGPAGGVNNIVEGPDGNLWFTEGSDAIGRITPSGHVTTYSVGNEAYGPWDITPGSDGNLWFTFRSPSTNAIGRITLAGVATLFTSGLSPGDVAVHDITEGPDGNVWFTEEFGNRIGKVTPSGVITEYSSGISANAGLVDITAGPDGNLWFTENSLNQIGRITTSGTVTEFSHGISADAGPGSITSARGFVWFTEANAQNLGRVTTSGRIVEYPEPALLGADVAAMQSNQKLWITDYTGNGVVEFTP